MECLTKWHNDEYHAQWGHGPNCKVLATCADGKTRTATLTAYPDTYFTIPARVKAYGYTVSGFVTIIDGELHFVAQGKNRERIPKD